MTTDTNIDLIALRAMIVDALDAHHVPVWSLTPGLSMRRDDDGLVIISNEGDDLATIPGRYVPHIGRLQEVAERMVADALGADPVVVRDFDDELAQFMAGRGEPPSNLSEHAAFVHSVENEAQRRTAQEAPTAPGWMALGRWAHIEYSMDEYRTAVLGG